MTFVWAHGQSGKEFYKDDELKYHGNPRDDKVITRGFRGKKTYIHTANFSSIKSVKVYSCSLRGRAFGAEPSGQPLTD